jgi:hypothetical protein
MVSWERSGSLFKLLGNAINDGVLSKIASLISSEDLKCHLVETLWRHHLSYKEARFASVIQIEFLRDLISINPLSPYFKFVRIPETSGSEGAPSKHPDFSLYDNFFSLP